MSDNKSHPMRGLIDPLMGQSSPSCQALGEFLDKSDIPTIEHLLYTLKRSQPQETVDIETPEVKEWNDIHLADHVYINGLPIRTLADVDIEMVGDTDNHAIVTLKFPSTAPTLDLDKISSHAQVSVRGAGNNV